MSKCRGAFYVDFYPLINPGIINRHLRACSGHCGLRYMHCSRVLVKVGSDTTHFRNYPFTKKQLDFKQQQYSAFVVEEFAWKLLKVVQVLYVELISR